MLQDEYDDFLTSEFNRTHAGLNELIQDEKYSRDTVDPCAGYVEPKDVMMITGHRPDKLGGYGVNVFNRLVRFAEAQLKAEQPDVVVSGMAMGVDLAFAVAAIRLRERGQKIALTCAVPFGSQYTRWKDAQVLFVYTKVLCKADDVVLLRRGSPRTSGQAAEWLDERNVWMVRHSTRVLALWSGASGGTKNAVAYAKSIGLPVKVAWQEWLAFPT